MLLITEMHSFRQAGKVTKLENYICWRRQQFNEDGNILLCFTARSKRQLLNGKSRKRHSPIQNCFKLITLKAK